MEFRDIKGYEGMYQISDTGVLKSLDRLCKSKNGKLRKVPGIIIKLKIDKYGYPCTHISKDSKRWNTTIHKLVALTFIPNPDNLPQINHINGIKTDNRVENLEWITVKDNVIHAVRMGLINTAKGERRAMSKMTDETVIEARRRYKEKQISLVKLAKDYSICPQTLHSIILRRTWKHI